MKETPIDSSIDKTILVLKYICIYIIICKYIDCNPRKDGTLETTIHFVLSIYPRDMARLIAFVCSCVHI